MLLLFLLLLPAVSPAVAQYVWRIGVIGEADGEMLRGARLAARQINQAGGIRGGDGTRFSLQVVDTPADNMEIAIANMRQARVIAVQGPQDPRLFARHMADLQALEAPVFTPAGDNTLLLGDGAGRLFRSRAPDRVLTEALAHYLAHDLQIGSLRTVQLDDASTANLIALANALTPLGLPLTNLSLRPTDAEIERVKENLADSPVEALAIFGPPAAAAQLYAGIREAGFAGVVIYGPAGEQEFAQLAPAEDRAGLIGLAAWSPWLEDPASDAFALAYARAFNRLPGAIAAQSYDAVNLVAEAMARNSDIAALDAVPGVQGELSPARFSFGEIGDQALITRANADGTEDVVARYAGGAPIDIRQSQPIASPTPAASPTPPATPLPSGFTLTVQTGRQNVRSGPGTQYHVIGQLSQGDQALVLGANPDRSWFVIDFEGRWGWMAAYLVVTYGNPTLLPVIQPPATPTPPPPIEPDLVVLHAGPPRLTLDQSATVEIALLNQGLTASGPFAIAASLEPGGIYAGVNLPGLAAQQQVTALLQAEIRGASGPQSVVIVVDLNQEVSEGPAGEANNQVYAYNYMADRAELASGSLSVAPGDIDLDGFGRPDLSWDGGALRGLDDARMYLLSGFATIDSVHYDAIDRGLANARSLPLHLLPGATIGMITADGHGGALHVREATGGGALSFDYRVYR